MFNYRLRNFKNFDATILKFLEAFPTEIESAEMNKKLKLII